jgi:hypothetical protein
VTIPDCWFIEHHGEFPFEAPDIDYHPTVGFWTPGSSNSHLSMAARAPTHPYPKNTDATHELFHPARASIENAAAKAIE